MLHAHTHPHPQANRIAGYTLAMGFNAMLLLLLLVPMQGPPTLAPPGPSQPTITWFQPQPDPPAVVPTIPAVIQPPQPVAVIAPPAAVAPTVAPVLVEQGSEQAAPTLAEGPATDTPAIAIAAQPLPGVSLQYEVAPPPVYPRAALYARSEGTVLLEVLVDVDGRPLRVDVRRSSGDRRLDAAARDQVLERWRFHPAIRDGRPMQAIGLVPINFRLR